MKEQFSSVNVRKIKIYEDLVEQIKIQIIKGNLKDGMKLPSERDLSEMFNISRGSVRLALAQLQNEGLVTRKVKGRNFFVHCKNQVIREELAAADQKVWDLLELLLAFEPEVAVLAAQKANQEAIGQIEKAVAAGDEAMHLAIANAADNSAVAENLLSIHKNLQSALQEAGKNYDQNAYEEERLQIYQTINAGEQKSANQAMKNYLLKIQTDIF